MGALYSMFIRNLRRCFFQRKSLDLFKVFSKNDINIFTAKRKPFIMKINTPEFTSLFTDELLTLLGYFEKYNYEIRIAGGAVRDILLGKSPKDVDFATTATPDQMKEMFEFEEVRMINLKGEKHGTITARINKDNFEVTTLRIDMITDGRHAEVQFTTDWELDSNRRDLTINSMFLDRDGNVYDYFDGIEDLNKRRVAFVGSPNKRIQEDYLRILRYFRFYGRIADKPDFHEEETLKAISDNISGLSRVSGERIWLELSKILTGNHATSLVQKLVEVGAGSHIGFPNKPNIEELISVWEKGKNLNLHPVTLIAALINNEEEMKTFQTRCKMSAFERDLGLFIIQLRNNEQHELKTYQRLMLMKDGKLKDIRFYILELFKYKADLNLLHEFQSWDTPIFPINGAMLLKMGIKPGIKLGLIIKELKNYWIEHDFQPGEKELIDRLPEALKKDKPL